MPEGAQQLRPFGIEDSVAGELPDVQVQRDQVVDLVDFALSEPFADFQTAGSAIDVFAPGFGDQAYRIVARRLLEVVAVSYAALGSCMPFARSRAIPTQEQEGRLRDHAIADSGV